jgi:SPP1 gp7 family putative phage head morphogenesis protein
MHREVEAAIGPRLAHYVRADANVFGTAIDGIVAKYVTTIPARVGALFTRHAKSVAAANAKQLRVIGVRPSDLRIDAAIATARNENIRLVEKAMRSYAQDVREIFEEPDTFGERVEVIKVRLVERGNVSESRAELIARDQTLKLNGQITKTRQENAGITKYVWSTSLDERVRPEHAALEGQTFDWNAPPAVGHPGQDFQCRCVAIPSIEP